MTTDSFNVCLISLFPPFNTYMILLVVTCSAQCWDIIINCTSITKHVWMHSFKCLAVGFRCCLDSIPHTRFFSNFIAFYLLHFKELFLVIPLNKLLKTLQFLGSFCWKKRNLAYISCLIFTITSEKLIKLLFFIGFQKKVTQKLRKNFSRGLTRLEPNDL